MTDRESLLAAVLDTPGDDTVRLVLSDYLQEHDEPALGRFIRAGVIAARFRDLDGTQDPDYHAVQAAIAAVCSVFGRGGLAMRQVYRIAALWLLSITLPGSGAEKQPVPPKAEQDPIRTRLKTRFKTEYTKVDRSATVALAVKLVERAAEEKENHATRYVMLTEATILAARGGEIDIAVRAARRIDQDFSDPDLKDLLATAFAENYGGKDRLDDFRALAIRELSRPTIPADQALLAREWLDAAKLIRTDSRLPALRRARFLLCEAMSSPELKGLVRTEGEKVCQEATAEIEKADAKAGRFTLYEGKWVIKYENKYTHVYVIKADGSLAFDRSISPDGTPSVKKDEQMAKLVRRGVVVLISFADGKLVERFSLDGEKLVVERFDPASLYPKSPNNRGEGVREK
ncbi:MAG: hypothetical protein JWO38_1741 [Gemmataceae bacterium]|nr:hypothetical protein [Gemmataceae bacterium]